MDGVSVLGPQRNRVSAVAIATMVFEMRMPIAPKWQSNLARESP